jgi:hypothetical protein
MSTPCFPAPASRFVTRARLWAEFAPGALARLHSLQPHDRECRFILPGSEGRFLAAGQPPLWHANPTPGRNPEWIFELNRHYHWTRLLRAHALTGDDTLATQVLNEWDDWIRRCPVPAWDDSAASIHAAFNAHTPWRTLEAGLRGERHWADAWEALHDHPALSADLRSRIEASFHDHARVLAAIPPVLWPRADHNHYLSENAGLLRITLLFPHWPESAAWRDHAWHELGRCIEHQITPDGGQIEGCPHYHNITLKSLALCTLLGRAHGLAWSADHTARLRRALAYTLHSSRPDAVNVPWGDSDATTHVPLQAALLAAHALDACDEIAVLQTLSAPDAWLHAVAESFWHVPDPEAWLARLRSLVPALLPRAHHQRQLDQVMLRTDWTRHAASVFFACHSPVNNGHAHLDPAGFDYSAFGRALAVDPGRYTYREGPDRYAFKSAACHNTVTIDDRDPYAYVSTWEFGPQHPGHLVSVATGPGWQSATSEQHNFAPVVHRRTVTLLDDTGELRVTDTFSGLAPTQTVQLWFHLDSVLVHLDATAETRDPALANLRVTADPALALTAIPGRVSEKIDFARASTRLRFSDTGGPAERTYVTRLVPLAALATP